MKEASGYPGAPGKPRWWDRQVHAARRPGLLLRAQLAAAIRAHFAAQGFLEADPSILQVSPGNETHLHGFSTQRIGLDGARETLYLHTSPEFAMKKLLAAGEERIFALAPVFRNREAGALHSSRVHHAGMVSGRAGLDDPYGRLLRVTQARGAGVRTQCLVMEGANLRCHPAS